jgi:intracellular multiplication protein IcmP
MADKKDTGTSIVAGWAILLVVFAVIGWVVWYFNKYHMMDAVRWIRWGELQALALVVPADSSALTAGNGQVYNFEEFESLVETTPKSQLTPAIVNVISTVTLSYIRVPLSMIFVAMGLWALFYGPGTQFRRRYDLGGLMKTQSKAFPYIAPLADFDPTKQPFRPPGAPVPADLPPFAEALSPEEWVAHNTIPTLTDRQIDRAATARAFARQLGRPWKGWKAMPPYRQVLLAAFALKSVRKRKEGDEMIARLAVCWRQGKLHLDSGLVRDARAVLRNPKISEKILGKCNQHAFETTALIRALSTAREEGGVMAPATFVWLRAYDRALWYPLNNLGRNAFHTEAMGAMCHYKAEKLIDRPIVRPKVDGAVEALAEYMKSMRARPIPEVDYTGSKRRAIKQAAGVAS